MHNIAKVQDKHIVGLAWAFPQSTLIPYLILSQLPSLPPSICGTLFFAFLLYLHSIWLTLRSMPLSAWLAQFVLVSYLCGTASAKKSGSGYLGCISFRCCCFVRLYVHASLV